MAISSYFVSPTRPATVTTVADAMQYLPIALHINKSNMAVMYRHVSNDKYTYIFADTDKVFTKKILYQSSEITVTAEKRGRRNIKIYVYKRASSTQDIRYPVKSAYKWAERGKIYHVAEQDLPQSGYLIDKPETYKEYKQRIAKR